jgi:hypothetical protein
MGVFWGLRWRRIHVYQSLLVEHRLNTTREPKIIAVHLEDLMSSRFPWLNAYNILAVLPFAGRCV